MVTPEMDGSVATATGNYVPVWTENHTIYMFMRLMSCKCIEVFTGVNIPQVGVVVPVTAAGERFPIWTKTHGQSIKYISKLFEEFASVSIP